MQGHAERLKQWISMGVVLLALACILHFTDGKKNDILKFSTDWKMKIQEFKKKFH